MLKNKKEKLGTVAFSKARELQDLINFLNSTTIGNLSNDIEENTQSISALENSITDMSIIKKNKNNYTNITLESNYNGSIVSPISFDNLEIGSNSRLVIL